MTEIYHPIFFDKAWIAYKYGGWSLRVTEADVCISEKRHGPFRRILVLARQWTPRTSDALLSLRPFAPNSEVIVQDFTDAGQPGLSVGGRLLGPVPEDEWILNSASYAVDLSGDDDTLLARMTSEYPRKIRKAARLGVIVETTSRSRDPAFRDFMKTYDHLARQRGVGSPEWHVVSAALDGGVALLFCAKREGEPKNYVLVYTTRDAGYFLHGAGIDTRLEGVGQYIHWEVMRHLRETGRRWYDLGGVAPHTVTLNKFKKAFGGEYLSYGSQYAWRSAPIRLLRAIRRRRASWVDPTLGPGPEQSGMR